MKEYLHDRRRNGFLRKQQGASGTGRWQLRLPDRRLVQERLDMMEKEIRFNEMLLTGHTNPLRTEKDQRNN
jgi:hypothetical protein